MIRWSISNIIRPISYKKFIALTTQFKEVAEQSFGRSCAIEIEVLRKPKEYTSFDNPEDQLYLDECNARNTMLKTSDLTEVTQALWVQAGYIEVTLRSKEKNPNDSSFARVEFIGVRPRQATYYIYPDDEAVKSNIVGRNRFMLIGDGYKSNGTSCGAVPESLTFY